MNFLNKSWDFVKNNWMGLILSLGFIYLWITNGILKLAIIMAYSLILVIYAILKVSAINNIIRYLLNMRTTEDGQKNKRKNKTYERKAKEEGHQVKFKK